MNSSTCVAPRIFGCDRTVHRGCAAANDGHAPFKLILFRVGEQINHLDGKVFIFDAKFDRFPETGCDTNRIKSLLSK